MTENIYPSEEIHVKPEYSPYVTNKKINGGQQTYINLPNKYKIKLDVYDLIPGITIIIDHSKIVDYFRNSDDILYYDHPEDLLLINYIVKGQCQYEITDDKYFFVKEDEITLYIKELNPKSFGYIGDVTILHILINKKQFRKVYTEYTTEYFDIVENLFKACEDESCIVIKSPDKIREIVNEFKDFDIQKELSSRLFYQLKSLECLVLLYELGIEDEKNMQRTYTDAQIRVVRNIKNSLSRNIASYVSLDTLSMSYGINLTTLKNCFKDMYGKPLYTWYKEYKFYRARELIKNTDYPISKIAHMVGYKSSSKFAKAFKKEMGVLPSSYRKKKK